MPSTRPWVISGHSQDYCSLLVPNLILPLLVPHPRPPAPYRMAICWFFLFPFFFFDSLGRFRDALGLLDSVLLLRFFLPFLPLAPIAWGEAPSIASTSHEPAHRPQLIGARVTPWPKESQSHSPWEIRNWDGEPDSWMLSWVADVNVGTVGWKASNSMGTKGRQSVWSKEDTQEEASSREHVFSSRKTSQERSQVLERSSLRS